jgi:hypothetical protein
MLFSCERPSDQMKAFMAKASIESRPACNAVTMPLYTMQFGKVFNAVPGSYFRSATRIF